MEIKKNSLSIRGESGLVKIVSDSVFDPSFGMPMYADVAECDIIVESNGFRVNKAIILSMPNVIRFLRDLKEVVDRGEGEASLKNEGDELILTFNSARGEHIVTCAMNDLKEGKENSVAVKYPIEPDYFRELRTELDATLSLARSAR
jgi:hypothetical protein